MTTDTVITTAEAEAMLKSLIANGASDAEIDAASLAVLEARDVERRTAERELVQRRLEGEIKREDSAAKRDALKKKADAAIADYVRERSPVVVLKYLDTVVTIKLAGGLDPHIRDVTREAVRLAAHRIDAIMLADLGAVRARSAGDDGWTSQDTAQHRARLADDLRVALKLGLVTVERVDHRTPIAAAPAPKDQAPFGDGESPTPAAAVSINQGEMT